jgi:hypothetical protein
MPTSELVKVERERRKTLEREHMLALLNDPQVVGVLTLLGGLYLAQNIPFSPDEGRNTALKGVATGGVVLASVCRAGLGGWPALAAAGIGGAAGVATEENTKALFSLNPADWARLFT